MEKAHHSFLVNQVTKTWDIDSSVNIQKRREDVVFKTQSQARFVNLSYVQSQDISSDKNLSINDRSSYLAENRAVELIADQILSSVQGFNTETDKFLVTDIFTEELSTQSTVPLYYQHSVSRVLSTGEAFVDIQILDKNFSPLSLATVKKDISNGVVYSNLENSYDPETGLYDIYYISYLVKKTNGVVEKYIEILNNRPVYRAAEVSDLNEFGNVQTGIKAYIIQEDIGNNFSIILPSIGTYGVRRLASASLKLLEPPISGPDDPWFVSVNNSKFIASVPVENGQSVLKYNIAEFTAQSFSPYYPYKYADETSYRVSKRIIKTIRSNIVVSDSELLYPEVFVYKKDGSLRFALTADPNKLGAATTEEGICYSNVLLGDSRLSGVSLNDTTFPVSGSSIDTANGFIVLPAGYEIRETDTVVTTYFYTEDRYELTSIDLNPLSESSWLRSKLVLFVEPQHLGETLTKTLYYLVVNEDGQVIDTDYENFEENISEGTLWYDRDPSTVSWAPSGSVNFLEKYSVEGSSSYALLVLGEVYVRGLGSPAGLNLNDIRQRGGGIPEEEEEALVTINPEVDWYWDIKMWDGLPYPAGATYFVEIPTDILEENGGRFSHQSVREICMLHTAAGVYPVVHSYNNYEPTITDIIYTPSGVELTWTQHSSDAIYNIYLADHESGPWTLVASGLINDPNGNSALIEMPTDVTKYILVTGHKDGEKVAFGGPLNGELI